MTLHTIKHLFTDSVLFELECDSLKLCRGTDLSGTDLIDAGQDTRGYRFVAQKDGDGLKISAGCRVFSSLEAAREHWAARHQDRPAQRAECLAKLDLIETVARARGWLDAEVKAA